MNNEELMVRQGSPQVMNNGIRVIDFKTSHFRTQEEVDAEIIAGIIATVGSLVLDGSLRNKIYQQAKELK